MAKIVNPTLFSKHFGIPQSLLNQAGLIDPFLEVDTELFIDPVLLEKSSNTRISGDGYESFKKHFGSIIRLLLISKSEGDVAWRNAHRLLDLSEPPENGLGYGGAGRSGSSRPESVRLAILRTTKEIIELGSEDPEMISLMGFFEEDIGPDTISDFTTRVIMSELAAITEAFCKKHKIPIEANEVVSGRKLPKYQKANGKDAFIVLIPKDIVRDLPIANSWSDIERAVNESQKIRLRVNNFLAGIAQPKVEDRKRALRQAVLDSSETFEEFLSAIKEHTSFYDPNIDALAYYKMKDILKNGLGPSLAFEPFSPSEGPAGVLRIVHECLNNFKHHVENGNLWEELWIDDTPKLERAAQLIFYAMSERFCMDHDIDITPEGNMGGGPVDFKFSRGFEARVLLEMKRCSGTVVHGYNKQLEIYKSAARTNFGVFVIMDYGNLGNKLKTIQKIREERIANGQHASDIVVINARKKVSASKR